MKFAHLADCHLGGWREEKLRELGLKTFEKAVDICIEKNVGFVLISGDLFNSALPGIELIKDTARILNKLKEQEIGVYIVAGSHDFSPSGKTMLDVFEESGLIVNVMKVKDGKLEFVEDKTGVKLSGVLGRRGGLERNDYSELDFSGLNKDGFKIFLFHTALTEFKPKELEKIESQSVGVLPQGFNYYAGGHVHYIFDTSYGGGKLVYPGALFPNNFLELEKFKFGGFYIVGDDLGLERVDIKFKDVACFNFNADGKTPDDVNNFLKEIKDIDDKIVLVRVEGILESGKISDVDFKILDDKNAFVVLKNINKLSTKEFEEMKVESGSVDEIEERVINEHLGQVEMENEKELTNNLMKVFSLEKTEGEKVADFERRLIKEVKSVIEKD